MPPLDSVPLGPVSDDLPAGENLELDPEFGELERAAQGKPEVQYGDTIEEAVAPDWKLTASIAQSLLTRTHDLRVMVHLAIARLHLNGMAGLAPVVGLIADELTNQWQHVHPQLDPEDDNDPMQRANAVAQLRNQLLVLKPLRELPLAGDPRKLSVCWRDMAQASGQLEAAPEQPRMTEAQILGAFRDTAPERLAATAEALQLINDNLPRIAAAFDRNAGLGTGPDLEPLTKLVRDIQRDFGRFRTAAGEADETAEASAESASADAAGSSDGAAQAARPAGGRGFASIQSIAALTRRDDALHALELASAYFRTQEPSSPLPLLIDRAKRLAGMEFMEILRDLAPDGLSQAQLVAGASSE